MRIEMRGVAPLLVAVAGCTSPPIASEDVEAAEGFLAPALLFHETIATARLLGGLVDMNLYEDPIARAQMKGMKRVLEEGGTWEVQSGDGHGLCIAATPVEALGKWARAQSRAFLEASLLVVKSGAEASSFALEQGLKPFACDLETGYFFFRPTTAQLGISSQDVGACFRMIGFGPRGGLFLTREELQPQGVLLARPESLQLLYTALAQCSVRLIGGQGGAHGAH
ncbi:hypothetical protein MRY87_07365 [bacterium]|nr:hypothetical protein [bacterium]